jgi:hypothetical protein
LEQVLHGLQLQRPSITIVTTDRVKQTQQGRQPGGICQTLLLLLADRVVMVLQDMVVLWRPPLLSCSCRQLLFLLLLLLLLLCTSRHSVSRSACCCCYCWRQAIPCCTTNAAHVTLWCWQQALQHLHGLQCLHPPLQQVL